MLRALYRNFGAVLEVHAANTAHSHVVSTYKNRVDMTNKSFSNLKMNSTLLRSFDFFFYFLKNGQYTSNKFKHKIISFQYLPDFVHFVHI